jgi:hypothetical protein
MPAMELSEPITDPAVPGDLCGYPVEAVLRSSQAGESDFIGPSYLAAGPGGRKVVLKPLDPDCLLKNRLHPSIKERLSRVRELALGVVANLYGVERDAPAAPAGQIGGAVRAWLIWEYVPGVTLSEYAADPGCTTRKLTMVARELVLGVEALHRQGIVHGAIRPTNVIVNAFGSVRVTHVSPLLYTDAGDDLWGILDALGKTVETRKEEETPLGRLVAEVSASLEQAAEPAPPSDAVLRRLATRLAALIEVRDYAELSPVDPPEAEATPRRRSLLAAAVVLIVGAAIAGGVWWALRRPAALPTWLQFMKDPRS